MRLSTLAYTVLPLLAVAEDITTLTSTATLTRTITISEVVASVTVTFAQNSTYPFAPTSASASVGTVSTIPPTSPSPTPPTPPTPPTSPSPTPKRIPHNFMGAASTLDVMYTASIGVVVMIAAAML